jgi:hypothetical protein
VLPPPASLPTSVPVELRIGKVEAEGDWVKLTPLQASNLAAQIKYYQALVVEGYKLGRTEGQIALEALVLENTRNNKKTQKAFAYGIAGSLLIGFGLGLDVAKDAE